MESISTILELIIDLAFAVMALGYLVSVFSNIPMPHDIIRKWRWKRKMRDAEKNAYKEKQP